jgi:hypothetical protein
MRPGGSLITSIVFSALANAMMWTVYTIAVHTHQTWGGQYIDLAVLMD